MKKLIKRILKVCKKKNKTFWIQLGLFILVIIIVVFISRIPSMRSQDKLVTETGEYAFPTKKDKAHELLVVFNEKSLKTVVADTTTERSIGLSGYDTLLPDEAMLFLFDSPDYYSFWMRDMNFPIDIIWLNENKEVVFIKEHAKPEDFPASYKPTEKADYVLEVYDGFVAENAVQIGSVFSWK